MVENTDPGQAPRGQGSRLAVVVILLALVFAAMSAIRTLLPGEVPQRPSLPPPLEAPPR